MSGEGNAGLREGISRAWRKKWRRCRSPICENTVREKIMRRAQRPPERHDIRHDRVTADMPVSDMRKYRP